MEEKEKYKLTDKGFWPTWIAKLLFTLISVKVWGLVAGTAVSTYLLMNHEVLDIGKETYQVGINGAQWVTFNTTVWALIFGMKEVFKISEKRDKTEKEVLDKQLDSKVKVAAILDQGSASPQRVRVNPDGTETVGSEPD